jgi:hypothetical protein
MSWKWLEGHHYQFKSVRFARRSICLSELIGNDCLRNKASTKFGARFLIKVLSSALIKKNKNAKTKI